MRNANEILGDILQTVNSIHHTITTQQAQTGTTKGKSDEPGDIKPTTGKTKSSDGSSMVNIVNSLIKFKKVDKETTSRFTNFIEQIVSITNNDVEKKLDKFSKGLYNLGAGLTYLPGALASIKSIGKKDINRFKSLMTGIIDIAAEMQDNVGDVFTKFTSGLYQLSSALPNFSDNLSELGSKRMLGRAGRAVTVLHKIYEGILSIGSGKNNKAFNRGIMNLYRMGRTLDKVDGPIRSMSMVLGIIGISILTLAGTLVASKALLGVDTIGAMVISLVGVIGGLTAMIFMLGKARKFVGPGIDVINKISTGFLILTAGIIGFTTSLLLINSMMGTETGWQGITKSFVIFLGVIGSMTLMFTMLGIAEKYVDKGTDVSNKMGVGLLILTAGVIGFTGSLLLINAMMGTGGGYVGMIKSFSIMLLIIGSIVGAFTLLGYASKFVRKGVVTASLMGLALGILGIAVLGFAYVAKQITAMDTGEAGEETGYFGGPVTKGLGKMGLILVGITGVFLGFAAGSALIALGAGVGILMAASMLSLTFAIKKVVDVTKTFDTSTIETSVKDMIGGVLTGFREGVAEGLGEGKKGLVGVLKGLGNATMILSSIGLLMSVAVTLSMLGLAVSAFAKVGQMRVIKGTDADGKPILGESVNIKGVADNISYTISTFLTSIIDSTTGLTRRQSRAIDRMGRALTGRRGMLRAVIDFADVLKTYSQFHGGTIGYEYIDEDGNKKRGRADIKKVTQTIVSSFGLFITELTRHFTAGPDGEDPMTGFGGILGGTKRKMIRVSKALSGRNGLLKPIMDFTDVLKKYSQMAGQGELGYTYINPNTGEEERSTVSINKVVDVIVKSISTFASGLASGIEGFGFMSGDKGKLRRVSKTLTGKHGILSPLSMFADTLTQFAKYGKDGKIPTPDGGTVNPQQIAKNIVNTLGAFVGEIGGGARGKSGGLLSKAASAIGLKKSDLEKNIDATQSFFNKFSGIFDSLKKLNESTTDIENFSRSINNLSTGIGLLGQNVDNLSTDKLDKIANIFNKGDYADKANRIEVKTTATNKTQQREIEDNTQPMNNRAQNVDNIPGVQTEKIIEKEMPKQGTSLSEDQINMLATKIGENVGRQVSAALKSGQFTFEFDTTKAGGATGKYFWEET